MSRLGQYDTLFVWLQASRGTGSGGSRPKERTNAGNLWGAIEWDSSNISTVYGANREVQYATVRLNNAVPVTTDDRLQANGYTFRIVGVRPGDRDRETILDCETLQENNTGD